MKKIHNRGVSFIELVIAVAIFGIMISPIVSTLIQTVKTSDKSKKAQTQYEYAENMMENVKNAGSYFYDTATVGKDPYLAQMTDGAVTVTSPYVGKSGGKDFQRYVITGKAKTSKKNGDYYYAIHVSNEKYADKEAAEDITDVNDPAYEDKYKNPNNTAIPDISSFNSSELAIINGTMGNYDLTVTNAFMSKKLDILKVGDKARWEQYTKQKADIVAFPNDKAARAVIISVASKKESIDGKLQNVYTVSCRLKYMEKSTYKLKDGVYANKYLSDYLSPIEYTPYQQKFVGKLPAIYLMYNPCLYNNNYMNYDYILIDTDDLKAKDTDVNLYIVETAEKYSDDTLDALVEMYIQQYKEEHNGTAPSDSQVTQVRQSYSKSLINDKAIRERSDVHVDIMSNASDASNLKVYHNLEVNAENKTPIAAVNKGFDAADASLLAGYSFVDTNNIDQMQDASTKKGALYDIKIYVSDKPFVSSGVEAFEKSVKDKEPILTGSKGGN